MFNKRLCFIMNIAMSKGTPSAVTVFFRWKMMAVSETSGRCLAASLPCQSMTKQTASLYESTS